MNIPSMEATYTVDDLLAMSTDRRFELVNGKLVEKQMGARSSRTAGILFYRIEAHASANQLGMTFPPDAGYHLFPDNPRQLRQPDVSFVRRGRLPGEDPPDGWLRLVPDLIAEVISPNDIAEEVTGRIADYLRAGVSLVWVLDPKTRLVMVFRPNGTARWLLGTGELSGEEVLPGFTCRVEDLFPGPVISGASDS